MKNKIYDVIFFVGGAFIVVYSLVAGHNAFSGGFRNWAGGAIAVGVSLIVIGFLRRSWNKKEKKNEKKTN